MSLVIISTRNFSKKGEVRFILKYLAGNKVWNGIDYTSDKNCFTTYGFFVSSSDMKSVVEELTNDVVNTHYAFGYDKGYRYGYHIMLDFNGCIPTPEMTGVIGVEINNWWNQFNLSWIQGVHLTKKKPELHLSPHLHVFVSSIILDGDKVGTKFCIGKKEIEAYKLHINKVLKKYNLPEISMKYF